MPPANWTQKEKEDYQRGLEYQDFAMKNLEERDIAHWQFYSSDAFQLKVGEGPSGVECKYDDMSETTKRLFIETKTRRDPNTEWKDGGIYQTNCSRYFQGNLQVGYLFNTSFLKKQHATKKWEERPKKDQTAYGFLVPLSQCEQWAKEGKIQRVEWTEQEREFFYKVTGRKPADKKPEPVAVATKDDWDCFEDCI